MPERLCRSQKRCQTCPCLSSVSIAAGDVRGEEEAVEDCVQNVGAEKDSQSQANRSLQSAYYVRHIVLG